MSGPNGCSITRKRKITPDMGLPVYLVRRG